MKRTILLALIFGVMVSCQRPVTTTGTSASASTEKIIPESINYLSRNDWGANVPVLPMRSHTLTNLTIHHTATKQLPDKSLTDKMKALQKFSQEESKLGDGRTKQPWADIPYHLYVDVHGEVAEGRDINYAGDSNTAYDPAGHLLVVVEGNFEEEEITPQQMRTLELLVLALAKKYNIPADNLGAHKDYASTLCPGSKLYAQIPYFQKLVSEGK